MNKNAIDQELATLREQINGRASLLQTYNVVTNQLADLPKGKENYKAILALNEEQEKLLTQLKENKKLQETYLQKIQEKAELLKKEDPVFAEKITNLVVEISEKEAILLRISESVTVVTELLNEVGKLNRQGGKAKVWGIGDLLGGLFSKGKKQQCLQEAKSISTNIRKLTKRYKKELGAISITELKDLPVNGFLVTVNHFLNNPVTEIIAQFEIRSLLKKSKNFESELLQQLEKLEEKESALETAVKKLQQEKIHWIEEVRLA